MIKISQRNEALDGVKDFGLGIATGLTDEAAMAAAKKSGLVAVQNVAKNAKPTANIAATIVGIAANPLINEAEARLVGPQKMYQSRYQDILKNIQAIQKLIPNDNKINMLIQQLQQTIQQGSQLFQKKATYNNKNTRLAVIGEFNTGQYARDALIGAGTGAIAGLAAGGVGAAPGAIIGAVGGGLGSAAFDIAYQFKNNYQKASWQAGEMEEKIKTLFDQIKDLNPQIASMLRKIAKDIKNEIEVRFEKKSGASYKNEYDEATQQAQGQGQQQGGMPQLDSSSLDPELAQAVTNALQIYSQAKQAYYMNPQMYEQLRMQYQQILQQINAYIAQNYPGQDANQILAIYMNQANFGMQQQPMQQQPMHQQPMMQQPMQQSYNQQNYQQPMQNSYLRTNNF
jgi:DNA repair exonuclease SbcCD ATPase subunit